VATVSRLLEIIGLFCKRALEKKRFSAKETYNFKEPTNRSHPIAAKWAYLFCVLRRKVLQLPQISALLSAKEYDKICALVQGRSSKRNGNQTANS